MRTLRLDTRRGALLTGFREVRFGVMSEDANALGKRRIVSSDDT